MRWQGRARPEPSALGHTSWIGCPACVRQVRWGACSDPESGLQSYSVRVLSGGAVEDEVILNSDRVAFRFTALALRTWTDYAVEVRAVNGFGGHTVMSVDRLALYRSSLECSAGDGEAGTEPYYVAALTEVIGWWRCRSLVALRSVQISAGRVQSGYTDVAAPAPSVSPAVNETVRVRLAADVGSYLHSGAKFHIAVEAVDELGREGYAVSLGVILDRDPPYIAEMRHGTDFYGDEGEWQADASVLRGWVNGHDDVSATTCWYSIPDVGDTGWLPLHSLSAGRWSFTRDGLTLVHNRTYRYDVYCEDAVNRSVSGTAPGVRVDLTPPDCTTPAVGASGAHREAQRSSDRVRVRFACDDRETGIVESRVLIGSSAGHGDLYDGEAVHDIYQEGLLPHGEVNFPLRRMPHGLPPPHVVVLCPPRPRACIATPIHSAFR